jgi:CelD/BcsL family acetyltransferase involved in cellulose biosynthesis
MTAGPFQTLAWQRGWWHHLGAGELVTMALRSADHTLRGIACLTVQDGVVRFNAGKEETDWLDLIAPAADAPAVWQAVLEALHTPAFPAWHTLDLWNIPAGSATRTALPPLAAAHGLTLTETVAEVCPVIALPATFDDWIESLESRQRREIRRHLRHADGNEAQLVVVTESADLPAATATFLTLLQASTPEKAAWLTPARRAFFHDLTAATFADGSLELLLLEIEGEPAAGLCNFRQGDRILVYNSGLEPQKFGRMGAGTILTALSIRRAIEHGYRHYDFLRGDEAYKYRLGGKDETLYRLTGSR